MRRRRALAWHALGPETPGQIDPQIARTYDRDACPLCDAGGELLPAFELN
jgi:hypothetical protein